jgi:hypothetical protein
MKSESVDLNEEGKFVLQPVLDRNLHPIPVRLAARLVDPGTFVISRAMLKSPAPVCSSEQVPLPRGSRRS